MPRRRDDDSGEYERPTPKRGKGLPVAVWVAIIAGAMAVSVGAAGLLAASWWAGGRATVPKQKTWTRDEFRTMLNNKTKDEVLELVGRPDRTVEPGAGNYWRYTSVTVDPVSGKVDTTTFVRFNVVNRVSGVDF